LFKNQRHGLIVRNTSLVADDNRRMELMPPRAPGEDEVNYRVMPGMVSNDDGACALIGHLHFLVH